MSHECSWSVSNVLGEVLQERLLSLIPYRNFRFLVFLELLWLGKNKGVLRGGMPFPFCQPFCIHRNTSSEL